MENSKYIRRTAYFLIDKSRTWKAGGCNTYVIYNMSNVNVTVNNVLVLRPGQFLSGPTENPHIIDDSSLDFQFDMLNTPEVVQPDTGPAPEHRIMAAGLPSPTRDLRVIIIQSFLEKAN